MISEEIKVFIEDNKDLIENNKWQQFWDNYIDYADTIVFYEDSYYDEINEVLFIAGILCPRQSFKDRRDSVKRKLVDKLFNIAIQKNMNRITKQARLSWSTMLGLSEDEVLTIMDEVCVNYGYEPKHDAYYNYKEST